MPYKDLRDFLNDLDKRGELVKIKRELNDGYEVFSILWKLWDMHGPAFIAKIKGYDIQIVSNLFGTLTRWSLACGLPLNRSLIEYRDLFAQKMDPSNWAEPKIVKTGPCKEVILYEDDVDLLKFPILKWHPNDDGAYITLPIVITKDERFGMNAGIYRMKVVNKNTTTIMCVQLQDIGIHIERARRQGKEKIPCSVVIGADPSIIVAAATKLSLGQNELAFASALRDGEAVEVVKCETNDLLVPATSEIVLEGEIALTERAKEGPLAEFCGYFEEPMMVYTFKVKCITHRRNPLYPMTLEGHPHSETVFLRLIPQMASFHRQCKERISGYRNSYIPPEGRGLCAVISISKRLPGWGKQAIFQAASIPYVASAVNVIIVVDDDINITNLAEILWAISTRVDPEKDVIILPKVAGVPSNPSAPVRPEVYPPTGVTDISLCSKLAIDATLKLGPEEGRYRPMLKRVYVPTELMEKVELLWKKYGF